MSKTILGSADGRIAINSISTDGVLLQRLQPDAGYVGYTSDHVGRTPNSPTLRTTLTPTPTTKTSTWGATATAAASGITTILSHFLPVASTSAPYRNPTLKMAATPPQTTSTLGTTAPALTTQSPPSIANLVVSSVEELNNIRDVTFDIFDDEGDLFGSPLAFDASENGLWNGRFVPPPPRPPFLVDEAVLSDGLTTCDLCSWAMPTKSTFIFEGTIEKASELGWPLTLIIVSILSALLGAIVMVTVVRCRRKKASNNRNATHVQWWSRNKRPSSNNNNNLRRSNIYTAHPADSIRGLQQSSLSAASSLTAITAMGAGGATNATIETAATATTQHQHAQELDDQQRHQTQNHLQPHNHSHHMHATSSQMHHHHNQYLHFHHPHQHQHQYQHKHHHQKHQHHQKKSFQQEQQDNYNDFEHEYHQPQLSSSISTSSASTPSLSPSPSPSLTLTPSTIMPNIQHTQLQHQPQQHSQQYFRDEVTDSATPITATSCRWPNTTMLLAS